MIIYNVTIKVSKIIADEWLTWMKNVHIQDMIQTGCFQDATILRLLETDDTDGPTYAIQYRASEEADYTRYIAEFAETLRKKSFDKWGDQFIAFRSVLQIV